LKKFFSYFPLFKEFRRVFLPTTQRVKCWRQLLVLTRRRKRNDVENIKFERRQESGGGCEESDGLGKEGIF